MAFVMNAQTRPASRRGAALAVAALGLSIAMVPAFPSRIAAGAEALLRVIVQETPTAGDSPEQTVRALGGTSIVSWASSVASALTFPRAG